MGIDLTLAAIEYERLAPWLPSALVCLNRNYDLQDAIKELPSEPLTGNILWYEGDGLKPRFDDQYGEPLKFVRAVWFRKLELVNLSPGWNLAAMLWVRELPPETPVVLYWH